MYYITIGILASILHYYPASTTIFTDVKIYSSDVNIVGIMCSLYSEPTAMTSVPIYFLSQYLILYYYVHCIL